MIQLRIFIENDLYETGILIIGTLILVGKSVRQDVNKKSKLSRILNSLG